jgi:hypothetical protein
MAIKSSNEVYKIIEELIKKSEDEPLTCVDLFEDTRIAKLVDNVNRLSDYLGHMWRTGLLQRWYNNKPGQKARYGYTWKEVEVQEPQKVEPLHVVKNDIGKPQVTITEDEKRIILDFPSFTIIVQSKDR